MSIHKSLDLLGSIHDPLLQHQRDRLGNLSAKGQLVEFARACRVLAANAKKLNDCYELITEVSSLPFDGGATAQEILSELDYEIATLLGESVPFREHSWFDVVDIFGQKVKLLVSSLNHLTSLATDTAAVPAKLSDVLDDTRKWLMLLDRRVRFAAFS